MENCILINDRQKAVMDLGGEDETFPNSEGRLQAEK